MDKNTNKDTKFQQQKNNESGQNSGNQQNSQTNKQNQQTKTDQQGGQKTIKAKTPIIKLNHAVLTNQVKAKETVGARTTV